MPDGDKKGWVLTYRGTVFPWHCDHIGHMNVMWYVSKFDDATWQLFARIGITPTYLRNQNRGMAGLEQRVLYRRELRAGDVVSIRSAILEMREKVIRYVHEMVNDETGELAAAVIITSIHMDTDRRRSCSFPRKIIESGRPKIIPYDPAKAGFRNQ
jgi:acyl-CoA thioester hydrolase